MNLAEPHQNLFKLYLQDKLQSCPKFTHVVSRLTCTTPFEKINPMGRGFQVVYSHPQTFIRRQAAGRTLSWMQTSVTLILCANGLSHLSNRVTIEFYVCAALAALLLCGVLITHLDTFRRSSNDRDLGVSGCHMATVRASHS